MKIDWITVAAQIVNFLILVWLLKRFLYAPVMRAMEQREQRIRERLEEAETSRAAAEQEARAYRERQQTLEQQREQFLAEAREAAEAQRVALEAEARQDIENRRRDWTGQLENQRESFLRELRRQAARQFHALARRTLTDLANAELEEQIALSFIAQIDALPAEVKEKVAGECARQVHITVLSLFELSATARRHLTRALHEWLGEAVQVDYEPRPTASCGIELRVGSESVAWNMGSYLDEFEKAVDAQFSAILPADDRRAAG